MALRTHLDLFRNGASHSERVFVNSAGKPIAIGNYERLFRQVRTRVFSPGSPLSTLTPYGLRHTSVSICLRAGVSIAETARRHGHSPSVLLGVYAGLLEGEEQRSNQLIDTILSRMEER